MTGATQSAADDMLIRMHRKSICTEVLAAEDGGSERQILRRSTLFSDEQLLRAATELQSTWALDALVARATEGTADWGDLRSELILHGDRPRLQEPLLDRIPLVRLWNVIRAASEATGDAEVTSSATAFIAHRVLAGEVFPSDQRDALAGALSRAGRHRLAERIGDPSASPSSAVVRDRRTMKRPRGHGVSEPEITLDLVVVSDCSGTTGASFAAQIASELAAAASQGLRVGILHRRTVAGANNLPLEEAVERLINQGIVYQLDDEIMVAASLVVVRHAGAAQGHPARRLLVNTERVIVVDDPSSGDVRGGTFASADVAETVSTWFGVPAPEWLRVVPLPATVPQARRAFNPERLDARDGSTPALSIVMPVYNVARFLEAAIVSVLYQEFQDFELIIVDDASTDGSARIIDMYASLDSRVRVVSLAQNTIGGAGIPSNIGIRHARGRYLGFADSDDIVLRSGFARMIEIADRTDTDVVIGGFGTFGDDLRLVEPAYDQHRVAGVPRDTVISAASHPDLLRLSPVPWRKLYRRSFIDEFAIEYPEGDYFYEDNPLHWTVLALAESVVLTDERISLHRRGHAGQTISSMQHKKSAYAHHFTTALRAVLAADSGRRQVLLDVFVQQLIASQWVVRQQTNPAARAMIAKRFATLLDRATAAGAVVPTAVHDTVNALRSGYPHRELTAVIPVGDGEGRLRRTLDSVLATAGVSLDVLLIDVAATDETATLVADYTRRHANVHIFEQGQGDSGRSWNSAIPLITGRYALFLEPGDIVDPIALGAAVHRACADDADLLLARHRLKKSSAEYAAYAEEWRQLIEARSDDQRRLLAAQTSPNEAARLIRTEVLQDANIFFGGAGAFDELSFHWQSLANAERIIILARPFLMRKNAVRRREIARRQHTDASTLEQLVRWIGHRLLASPHHDLLSAQWSTVAARLTGAHSEEDFVDEQD